MRFKGERVERLKDMQRGKMYVLEHDEIYSGPQAYAFVFLKSIVHTEEMFNTTKFQEITYMCDIINAPEGKSEFKLFESIDQKALDKLESRLYTLLQI